MAHIFDMGEKYAMDAARAFLADFDIQHTETPAQMQARHLKESAAFPTYSQYLSNHKV
jgi:hypothetical protein